MQEIIIAIVPAAGQGIRMGQGKPKQFLLLEGISLLTHVCLALEAVDEITAIIIAVPPGFAEKTRQYYLDPFFLTKEIVIINGGPKRQDSVAAACQVAANLKADWIVIHDAVRPLVKPELFKKVIYAARKNGAAIAALPCIDTIKKEDNDNKICSKTFDRHGIWLAQTPQVFRLGLLQLAQKNIHKLTFTDEASLIEMLGKKVKLVIGRRDNFKITTPEDLELAKNILTNNFFPRKQRIGQGIDMHRLVPGRPLILGGIHLDFKLGLLGHSDADVLTHAVIDALLSSIGLGDIGHLFPDNDAKFKDANSLQLLELVVQILINRGWRPLQISATILAQQPKIAPYSASIAAKLAQTVGIENSFANVAASTSEGLGFTGRGEGIAAIAIATVESYK